MFVSIHHNACPGEYGVEVLCIKDNYQEGLSTKVGEAILNELSSLGLRNRGVKDRRDLYVINNTSMPALIGVRWRKGLCIKVRKHFLVKGIKYNFDK